ncbi:MAG: nucleotidyltransferase domain-containing protein [Chloracidobacterium sp.]|nr:nucleotidyltransferase domain-containing protein [Chloracidobacterium sp.]
MSLDETIQDICGQIVRKFRPHKIILFGSHACGVPTKDSDLDFLVIMPYTGNELQQMANVRGRIDSKVPLDVLVKTPEQIERDLKANNFFTRDIIENGITLYESGDLGVGK